MVENWRRTPSHAAMIVRPFIGMQTSSIMIATVVIEPEFLKKFQCYKKLLKVTAYWLRYFKNRAIVKKEKLDKRVVGALMPDELKKAELLWIKKIQALHLSNEIHAMKTQKRLPNNSKIVKLAPFLDSGIIKVGGRLRFADINTEKKFPILLPRNSHLTVLLIRYEHERLLHAAELFVQASLQHRFWIVGITGLIKCVIHRCVKCHRYNSDCMQQFMADLPASRINPSDVFAHLILLAPLCYERWLVSDDFVIKVTSLFSFASPPAQFTWRRWEI